MRPIIIAENVSKKYSRNSNSHLEYGLGDLFRELFCLRGKNRLRNDEFWAVDDVSFHMNPGESLALVGRNGSGKTTVLKMLNGLTKPDCGTIIMDGKVQALINLGAGFNFSLSGKDNIFNSAALMGMTKSETFEILDEIIEFSELEEFIDSPVGTYSSGMKARLGFSVAVHLKPEILLIDEILAVGDHAFQNKCFIKMQELKHDGVTMVLVSHSQTHVLQLCERALWLHEGKACAMGSSKQVVKQYLDFLDNLEVEKVRKMRLHQNGYSRKKAGLSAPVNKTETEKAAEKGLYHAIYDEPEFIDDLEVRLLVDGKDTDCIMVHDQVVISYRFRLFKKIENLNVSLVFYRKDGLQLAAIGTINGDLLKSYGDSEIISCSVRIPDFNLSQGTYVLVMPIHEGKSYLYRNVVREFVVKNRDRLTWAVLDFQYDYEVHCADN